MSREERKKLRAERKAAKLKEKKIKTEAEGTAKERYKNLAFAYKFIWRANKKLFLFRIPLLIMQSVQAIIPILFTRALLNELTVGRDIKMVLLYATGMAGSTFIVRVFSYFFSMWDSRERERFQFNVSKMLSEAVMEMSYSTIEDPEMQDFVWLAQNNQFDTVLQLTTAVVGSFLTLFSISAIVFTLSPVILGTIFFTSVLRFLIERYQRTLPHKYNDERKRKSRINEYYQSLMSSQYTGKEVRTNNLEDWIYDTTESSWKNDLLPLDTAFQQKLLALQGVTSIIGMIQDIFVYIFLAVQVVHSSMTVGDFSMYLTAAGTFSSTLLGMSTNYSYLMIQTAWYLKDYLHCLKIAEKERRNSGNTHIGVPKSAEIEFRDVSFKYPKSDRMILEHVNIKIRAGETLSIVGVNGAGKTTFVKLLCRFYEPTEGEIFINNVPARDIPLTEYYRLLGVVFQDFSIFKFTFKENITMGLDANEERLKNAVAKCGLEERVKTLPLGMDTYIYKEYDPDGIELSGGEGQKIAIARAVYREAPIVIFDEPTSALDPIAEYDIYKNFHDLAEKRTAIYISHRMSSTRFTDRTAVFANSTIAEYGTHDELMEKGGIYAEMFSAQAKYYKD